MVRDENELLAQIPNHQLEITPIDLDTSATQEGTFCSASAVLRAIGTTNLISKLFS